MNSFLSLTLMNSFLSLTDQLIPVYDFGGLILESDFDYSFLSLTLVDSFLSLTFDEHIREFDCGGQ